MKEKIICRICGEKDDISHYIHKKELQEKQMCFSCNFWDNMLKEDLERFPNTVVIIDGSHYIIGPEDNSSPFRGFGGDKFQIEFNNGIKIVTTNLWCQGKIPKVWIDKFPDNARFERNLKWTNINEIDYLLEQNKPV